MYRKPYLAASGEYYEQQRMRALVRDNFTCQFARFGLTPIDGICTHELPITGHRKLQVHHIKGRMNFLPHQIEGHDLDNLICICNAHHEQIHPHMRFQRHGLNKSTDYTYERVTDYDPPDKEY